MSAVLMWFRNCCFPLSTIKEVYCKMQHTTSFLLLEILSVSSEWNISEVWICKFGHKKGGKDKIRTIRFLCSPEEHSGTKRNKSHSSSLEHTKTPFQSFCYKEIINKSLFYLLSTVPNSLFRAVPGHSRPHLFISLFRVLSSPSSSKFRFQQFLCHSSSSLCMHISTDVFFCFRHAVHFHL